MNYMFEILFDVSSRFGGITNLVRHIDQTMNIPFVELNEGEFLEVLQELKAEIDSK